jgi:hypothetical protein
MSPAAKGKSAGEARLLGACARGGCPVCRCLADDSARHLGAVLHEHVTDLEVRSSLRASRGFCNWHAALLQGLPGAAFGSAILSADLMARERARAQSARGGRRRGLASLVALREWLGRPARGTRGRPAPVRASCFVCEALRAAERRYLEAMVALVDDPRFLDAFDLADGLCAPHLTQLVEQDGAAREDDAIARLVALTCERWRRVEAALGRFIAKHEYRQRRPFTEEEGRAWRLALELLSGAPGVFGNALHGPAPGQPAPARRPRRPGPAGLGRGRA